MIKRYILHFEFHWGYRPRISIKRALAHGDVVVDGGEIGTLKACPECSGVGFLHVVEPKQFMQGKPESLWPAAPSTYDSMISPRYLDLGYELGAYNYRGGEEVWTHGADYIVQHIRNQRLYLTRKDVWEVEGHPPY